MSAPRAAVARSRLGGGASTQTACRLLLAMDKLGSNVPEVCPVDGAVKVVRSLSRLIKIDFWLRNPDYLADELLTEVETGRQPPATLALVGPMIGGKAPSLHRYPMAKYLYGAFERPDNALALLASGRLVRHLRVDEVNAKARRDYYLLGKGAQAAATMRAEVPAMSWYDQQADAIALIPEAKSGGSIRTRQYKQPEYERTPIGALIPEITSRVRERAEKVAGQFDFALTLDNVDVTTGSREPA